MNVNLDLVLVIQSTLCVHALKPLNISSCGAIFTVLNSFFENLDKFDPHFLNLSVKIQMYILL